MNDNKLNLKTIKVGIANQINILLKYAFIAFIVMTASIYGFLLLRINTLKNTEPSANEVSSQVQAARVPHIDQKVVKQLESLQDNSVSVQALFNEARDNPFQ